jgi:hypothetical protein
MGFIGISNRSGQMVPLLTVSIMLAVLLTYVRIPGKEMGCRVGSYCVIFFIPQLGMATGESCSSAPKRMPPAYALRHLMKCIRNWSRLWAKKTRLIGVIEGRQTEKGNSERNDRLLAVADGSHTHSDINSLNDLNKDLLKELEKFLGTITPTMGLNSKFWRVKARMPP